MKKKYTIILILFAFFVVAVPADAKKHELAGKQFQLVSQSGPCKPTILAGEPFHITHGWYIRPEGWNESGKAPVGLYDFILEVNGVIRDEDFVLR